MSYYDVLKIMLLSTEIFLNWMTFIQKAYITINLCVKFCGKFYFNFKNQIK